MRNFIISIIIFLLWAFLGMWWYYSCPMCSIAENTKTEVPALKNDGIQAEKEVTVQHTSIDGFSISNDIGADVFNFHDDLLIFNHPDSTGFVKIPETLTHFKDSVFKYLNKNQNKELLVTGWYKDGEWHNHNEAQNFGIDRANHIKNILTKFGVNPNKISIAAIKESFSYNNGHYNGGIKMMFKDFDASKAEKINNSITNKTLYTHFNARNFKPDNTLKAYTAELKNYLAKHPNKKVNITGHTDNVGEADVNEILARDRATNVMRYFIARGIDKNKLNVFSKGESAPVATNATQEGRALNRRIEIKVN